MKARPVFLACVGGGSRSQEAAKPPKELVPELGNNVRMKPTLIPAGRGTMIPRAAGRRTAISTISRTSAAATSVSGRR